MSRGEARSAALMEACAPGQAPCQPTQPQTPAIIVSVVFAAPGGAPPRAAVGAERTRRRVEDMVSTRGAEVRGTRA